MGVPEQGLLVDPACEIERFSNGELSVRIFPSGQLYGSAGAIKALASGALDLSVQANSTLSSFEPNLSVVALPMFFGATREQVREILDGPLGLELYVRLERERHSRNAITRLMTPAKLKVQFGDKLVREGDVVAAVFTSGNRDEDVFDHPDEFDLNRRKRVLLTFGRGPHMCPGAPLARLLLEVAIEGIVRRTRRIEITGEITMTNWPEYGPLAVPIRIVR